MKKVFFLTVFLLCLSISLYSKWDRVNYKDFISTSLSFGDDFIYANTPGIGFQTTDESGIFWNKRTGQINSNLAFITKFKKYLFASSYRYPMRSSNIGYTWLEYDKDFPYQTSGRFFPLEDTLFFTTTSGKIYKTIDTGNTWNLVMQNITTTYIRTLAFNHEYMYAGTTGDGIIVSSDYGTTWKYKNYGLTEKSINKIICDSTVLFACGQSRIYCSIDNAQTWKEINNSYFANYFITGMEFINGTLFVATNELGVYSSTDNGENWTKTGTIINDLGNKKEMDLNIKTLASYNKALYVSNYDGILKSIDYGKTWSTFGPLNLEDSILAIGSFRNSSIFSSKSGLYTLVFPKKDSSNISSMKVTSILYYNSVHCVGTDKYGFFYKRDNTTFWKEPTFNLTKKRINQIIESNYKIYAATDSGIYKAPFTDNIEFTKADEGISNKKINCMARSLNKLFAGNNDGMYYSEDEGNTWNLIDTAICKKNITSLDAYGKMVIAAEGNNLLLSLDLGKTWTIHNFGKNNVTAVKALPKKQIIIGTDSNGIYTSSNSGSEWKIQNGGLLSKTIYNISCYSIDNYPDNYAIGTNTGIYRQSSADLSLTDVDDNDTQNSKSDLTVFPNPCKNVININTMNPDYNSNIKLLNMIGEIILETPYKETIDLSLLNSGVYLMVVGNQSQLFIKE